MTFLSEDPTYLAGFLGLVAVSAFMALRITQQGKYLYWALAALASAVGVVAIEHFWVTENERIEQVVYELRRAVLAADVEGVLAQLTPDVEYVQNGNVVSGGATRSLIRENLGNASFDFVHISDLESSAGRQTKRGKAEFRVYAKGTLRTSLASYNMGTANSTWSLGFEQTAPHVWKVSRITPISLPRGTISAPRTAAGGQGPSGVQEGPDGEPPVVVPGRPRRFRGRGMLFAPQPKDPAPAPAPGPPERRDAPRQ